MHASLRQTLNPLNTLDKYEIIRQKININLSFSLSERDTFLALTPANAIISQAKTNHDTHAGF